MSYFSKALRDIMWSKRPRIMGTHIARALGKSYGHMSKIVTGKQPTISAEDMEVILQKVIKNRSDQAHLLHARCLDALLRADGVSQFPGADLICITIREPSAVLHDEAVEPVQRLSPEFERAMAYFRQLAINNDEAENWIISQAKLSGMKGK